jgi:hypothetical protein
MPLGPGTFVTDSSIAYPVPARGEHPREGTTYRVRAYLRYAGGTARLDTLVRFGHRDALRQQAYGGPAAGGSSGLPGWAIALLGALGALLAASALLALRRMLVLQAPARALQSALDAGRANGTPVSLMVIAPAASAAGGRALVRALRARLRHADRLCRLDDTRLLVIAPDTDLATAEALAGDLRRHLGNTAGDSGGVTIEVCEAAGDVSVYEVIAELHPRARALPAGG